MNLTILGGGNLAHAIAATASHYFKNVSILTSSTVGWENRITAIFPDNEKRIGSTITVSNKASDLIPGADVILSTLPGHLIPEKMKEIKKFINKNQFVGSITTSGGFFWIAKSILGNEIPLFGFQRVPFICRIIERGKSVNISGLKNELYIASINIDRHKLKYDLTVKLLEKSFGTKILRFCSYLESSISNSNPILHTCRLYSMLKKPAQNDVAYFYREWDDETSEILLKCDCEISEIIKRLNIPFPLFKTLPEHYGVKNSFELTMKMKSIEAFRNILFPLVSNDGKYYFPDPQNRYFQEDLPFGLIILKSIAKMCQVDTENIDKVIKRLQSYLSKEYLVDNNLSGKDISETGIPENFGVKTITELINL